jgi:hypothetical protein
MIILNVTKETKMKFSSTDYPKLELFSKEFISIDEIVNAQRKGVGITGLYRNLATNEKGNATMKGRKDDNLIATQFICLDIDHLLLASTEIKDEADLIELIPNEIRPTFWITSFSNGVNNEIAIHLFWIFDELLNASNDIKEIIGKLKDTIEPYFTNSLKIDRIFDTSVIKQSQYINGTNSNAKFGIDKIYNLKEFASLINYDKEIISYSYNKSVSELLYLKPLIQLSETETPILKKDSIKEIAEKLISDRFQYVDNDVDIEKYDSSVPLIKYPSVHYDIDSIKYWKVGWSDKDDVTGAYTINRIKNSRRRTLYLWGLIHKKCRQVRGCYSIDYLFNDLVIDVYRYFAIKVKENNRILTVEVLKEIATNIDNAGEDEFEKYIVEKDIKWKKYRVNPNYTNDEGFTKKQIYHKYRCQFTIEEIGNNYDISQSLRWNKKHLREMGIKFTDTRFSQFYNDYIKANREEINTVQEEEIEELKQEYAENISFDEYNDEEIIIETITVYSDFGCRKFDIYRSNNDGRRYIIKERYILDVYLLKLLGVLENNVLCYENLTYDEIVWVISSNNWHYPIFPRELKENEKMCYKVRICKEKL